MGFSLRSDWDRLCRRMVVMYGTGILNISSQANRRMYAVGDTFKRTISPFVIFSRIYWGKVLPLSHSTRHHRRTRSSCMNTIWLGLYFHPLIDLGPLCCPCVVSGCLGSFNIRALGPGESAQVDQSLFLVPGSLFLIRTMLQPFRQPVVFS